MHADPFTSRFIPRRYNEMQRLMSYPATPFHPSLIFPTHIPMAPTLIFPQSFQDVSDAVLLAQAQKKELAVTSGAYHNTSGSSYTKDGILVDLSKLNAVKIDNVNRIAYVQGGVRCKQVEEEAIRFGLAMPAGTVSDIGIAGLTVGGGQGWLSGQHGLVVDNLLSATVVVANGNILKASATENSDLFWGIRGGGSNFGIVVEFAFQLHQQRAEVFTTSLIFSHDRLPLVVQQINRWTAKQTATEAGSLVFFNDAATGQTMIEWFGFKNGDEQEGKKAFKGFVELAPLRSTSEMVPYEKLNTMMNKYIVPGVNNRLNWGTFLERLDLKPFKKAMEAFNNLDVAAKKSIVTFEFYHHDKVSSVAVQDMAFAHRAPVYNALVSVQWDNAAATFDASEAVRSIADKITAATGNTDIGYTNYADNVAAVKSKSDVYAKQAFGINYERMREVKRVYDPTGVFNRWFAVTPAE
ncbi:hypothetical protein FRB93_013887 [Tulasnella sp. JGI-2019a]|nr:hypothetical protein FRB93_013887 [Tulasnella sp. JGI-2019a]